MCGIAGLVLREPVEEAALHHLARRMGDAIAHRGPDGAGTWADPPAGLAFAHRRLAIVGLGEAGAQPMRSACGRFVLTFNGEIYNHDALRRRLEDTGRAPPWRGRSDTEVLLAALAGFGVRATLEAADGMFAFALWDREARTLTLARDRFGEKPLLYGHARGAFLFASEFRAIRAVAEFGDGDVDLSAVRDLLATGAIATPRSIHRSIAKLRPGTVLHLGLPHLTGRAPLPEPQVWWCAQAAARRAAAAPFPGGRDEALDALATALGGAVRSRLMADVRLGAMLSGGVDSGLVTALAARVAGQALRTFTVGFEDAAYDETAHAERLAAAVGASHTTIALREADAVALAPEVAAGQDEPFGDSSALPTTLLCRALQPEVTVALSGDGGDELFGGYVRHRLGPRIWDSLSRVPAPVRAGAAGLVAIAGAPRLGRLAAGALRRRGEGVERLVKAADAMAARSPEDLYRRLGGLWRGRADPLVGVPAPAPIPLPGDGFDLSRRIMLADTALYLPDDVLTKVDRASMSVGLEVRPPFLSPEVHALAWSMPTPWLVGPAAGKLILRRLASRLVPELDWTAPKRGFAIPLDTWLRGPLRPWASDLLAGLGQDGAIPYRTALLQRTWREHLAGRANHAARLWPVLALAAWRQRP